MARERPDIVYVQQGVPRVYEIVNDLSLDTTIGRTAGRRSCCARCRGNGRIN